tara:strand:- start:1082 stop:1195 length:114 start_codon:yes stop_codon:yes gene_type:complete
MKKILRWFFGKKDLEKNKNPWKYVWVHINDLTKRERG